MPTWITGKIIGYLFGSLIGVAVLAWAYDAARDYFIGAENTRTELANEKAKRVAAELSRDSAIEMMDYKEKQRDEIDRIRAVAQSEITRIRNETQKYKDVLTDRERLQRLTLAKPKLVERLANRATEKRIKDLEAIFNGN